MFWWPYNKNCINEVQSYIKNKINEQIKKFTLNFEFLFSNFPNLTWLHMVPLRRAPAYLTELIMEI